MMKFYNLFIKSENFYLRIKSILIFIFDQKKKKQSKIYISTLNYVFVTKISTLYIFHRNWKFVMII